jgi:hypothetical protein
MWDSLTSGVSFLNSAHFAGEWRLRHFKPMTQGLVQSSDGSVAGGARGSFFFACLQPGEIYPPS